MAIGASVLWYLIVGFLVCWGIGALMDDNKKE
jgi:hypothetical protein